MDRRSTTAWLAEGELRTGSTTARVARAGAVSDHAGSRTKRRGQSAAEDARRRQYQARVGGFGPAGTIRSGDAQRTDRRFGRRRVHGGASQRQDAREAWLVGASTGGSDGGSPAF